MARGRRGARGDRPRSAAAGEKIARARARSSRARLAVAMTAPARLAALAAKIEADPSALAASRIAGDVLADKLDAGGDGGAASGDAALRWRIAVVRGDRGAPRRRCGARAVRRAGRSLPRSAGPAGRAAPARRRDPPARGRRHPGALAGRQERSSAAPPLNDPEHRAATAARYGSDVASLRATWSMRRSRHVDTSKSSVVERRFLTCPRLARPAGDRAIYARS